MYIKITWLLLFALLCIGSLFGCKDEERREKEQRIRNTIISIPLDSMELLKPVRALVDYSRKEELPDYRYVIYYDSITCAPCKLHRMSIWRSIIKNAHVINANVDFMFIFHPSNNKVEDFRREYYKSKLLLPLYLDSIGIMERNNPLIKESSLLHAFLLNKDNSIVAIGDAGADERVERKFYDFLRNSFIEQ